MANPGKARASQHELALERFFREQGLDARKQYGAGRTKDVGDDHIRLSTAHGPVTIVIEAKSARSFNLAGGLKEAEAEAESERAYSPIVLPVLILKAPRKPIAKNYVVMHADTFAELLRLARGH